MRVTKYFKNSTDMYEFAVRFCNEGADRWLIRTTLRCDHVINENRKAIILVENETIVQRLITCRNCNIHGNSQELHDRIKELEAQLTEKGGAK